MDWIARAERLPDMRPTGQWDEESDDVLTYRTDGLIAVMRLWRPKNSRTGAWETPRWLGDDDPEDRDSVSHWMPLPAPPVATATQEATHGRD